MLGGIFFGEAVFFSPTLHAVISGSHSVASPRRSEALSPLYVSPTARIMSVAAYLWSVRGKFLQHCRRDPSTAN